MRTQPLLFWILRIMTGFFCWCLAFFLLKYLFPLTLLIEHWLENYSLQHSSGLTNGRLVVIIHLSTLLTSLFSTAPFLSLLPNFGKLGTSGSAQCSLRLISNSWAHPYTPGSFYGCCFWQVFAALSVAHLPVLGQLLLPRGIAAHPYCWVYCAISHSTRDGGYQYSRALRYLTGSAEWPWELEQKINLKQFVWKAIYLRTNKKQPSALKWMLISDWRVGGF